MGQKEDLIIKYQEVNKELGLGLSDELIEKVTNGLGPSIYNADSSKVSGTDPDELELVKQNYLIKKLGLADSADLDSAIAEVMEKMGSSNPNKYRALVYGLLCVKFGKESIYN